MFRSRKGAKSCFAEPISCFKESKVNHPRTPPLPAIFSTLSGCLSSPGKLGKGLGEPGELAMWQVNAWWNSLNHRIIFGVRTAETQQKTSGRGKCCSVNILKFRKTFASLLLQILQELYACWYLDTFCKNYSIKPKFEKKTKQRAVGNLNHHTWNKFKKSASSAIRCLPPHLPQGVVTQPTFASKKALWDMLCDSKDWRRFWKKS